MDWIDGHLDLAYLAECGRDLRRELNAGQARTGCVSLPALRRASIRIAFGTIFTEPGRLDQAKPYMYPPDDVEAAEAAGLRQLAIYRQWHAEGEIDLIRRLPRDGLRSRRPGADHRVGVILLMEGADPIRAPELVPMWFERGLRIVGLTWAMGTRYAGGNASPAGTGGITALGRDMIDALDEAGIIHDVSHLSDAAFDGLMASARGPVIASHSNCRALVEKKQRHLRDDQIKAIDARGGVVGLNLYSDFLFPRPGPGRAGGRRATVSDCVAHIEHVVQVMGHRRGIALGSDMDGGFGPGHLPSGLEHPARLHVLADSLRSAGWPDEDIHAFAHGNWERIISGLTGSR